MVVAPPNYQWECLGCGKIAYSYEMPGAPFSLQKRKCPDCGKEMKGSPLRSPSSAHPCKKY
ncbi:MAG: hypothetical protein COT24_05520 [Candidatus Kerfeldbacteria bacterium CG08_land_8_20_14_0_20_40_16]|uniref:Uncharacterized protein n=1 Tax=Candidatus Kerfeldbacteria bacterium CG08_land_8_20_14_0_20_40_16 TaxID=2014244 RepID=A0A2H0YWD1_9BACT|nr:MAG: hypothetical protein COT24_05520 [Candidatus Kerfeldbacteria bacterium CG08_land_8_20_14_0_20_40_16]